MFERLKKLFSPKKESPKLQIWCILEGPILAEDMPDDEVPEDATDESAYMVLKISDGDRVFDAEFWFDDMDDAYEIVTHFGKSIDPINLNVGDYEHVK